LNRVLLRREPITLTVGDRALSLRFVPTPASMPEPMVALPLRVDESDAVLHLSMAACERLRQGSVPAWIDAPLQLRGMLFEANLLPVIQALEAQLDVAIRFEGNPQRVGKSSFSRLAFALGTEGQSLPALGWIECDAVVLGRIASVLDAHPVSPRMLDALPIDARLEAGWQRLTVSDLRSLRPGDAVMLERFEAGYQLRLADSYSVPCTSSGAGKLRLASAPVRTPSSKESSMSAFNDSPKTSSNPFDDVPVRLVCEVGQVKMTLGELRSMGEGSVLSIGGDLTEPVRLMANGRCVGRGELVKLGDGLGVRVTSFAADE
jgi:type III secretion protein Q